MGWSTASGWEWSYNGQWNNSGQLVKTMLSYKNTSSTPQMITSVYLQLAAGTGTYTDSTGTGQTATGNGTSYTAVASITVNGTTYKSNTLTITQVTNSGAYTPISTKTFTFDNPPVVAVNATVSVTFTFTRSTSQTIVIARKRTDSSTYGGTTSTATYTITYDMNGKAGTAPQATTKQHGTNCTLAGKATTTSSTTLGTYTVTWNNTTNGSSPANSTESSTKKRTYTFDSWNTEANGSGTKYSASATYSTDASDTLYAIWTNNDGNFSSLTAPNAKKNSTTSSATLTYNANGGSVSPSSAPLSRTTTYDCIGYYTTATGGTRRCYAGGKFTPTAAGTETLYARFSSNVGNYTTVTLPTPTRSGYTFLGWYTTASGGTKIGDGGAKYTPYGGATIYAHWGQNVSITKNLSSQTVTIGQDVSLSLTATGDGLTYAWYYKNVGDSAFSLTTTFTGNTYTTTMNKASRMGRQIYCVVKDQYGNSVQSNTVTINGQYTITYDGNGHTSGSTASSTHVYTTSKALTANGYEKSGHRFIGWSTSSTATTATYSDKQAVVSLTETSATVTLYAVWSTNAYTVTFDANGGSEANPKTISGDYGTKLGFLPTTSRTGYTLKGWYTATSGGTKITAETKISGNTTYYAQWDPNTIKITLNKNGGSGGTSAFWYKYGISKFYSNQECTTQITAITRPSRDGYNYVSYTGDGTCGGNVGERYVAYDSVEFASDLATDIYKDATLTANWSARTFTITYDANGGSGAPSSQNWTYAQSGGITLSTTKPTLSGNTFVGWTDVQGGKTAKYSSGETISSTTWASNVKLYAVYSTNQYNLYVYPRGGSWNGSSSSKITVPGDYGDNISIPVPTRPGYIFAGWYKTAYGTLNNSRTQNSIFTSTSDLAIAVYNNSNNGCVTHTRQSDTSAGYTYTMKIVSAQDTSSNQTIPGLGGFVTSQSSSSGATFIHVFRAKIPKGYYLRQHNNSVGTSSTFTWLTSTQGTGEWQDYAYKLVCGTSGTFSTFGHVALYHDSRTLPVTWYVGGSQITKNPTTSQTFTYGSGDTYLYAQWIPEGLVYIYDNNQWKRAMPYIYDGSTWKQAIPHEYDSGWKIIGG